MFIILHHLAGCVWEDRPPEVHRQRHRGGAGRPAQVLRPGDDREWRLIISRANQAESYHYFYRDIFTRLCQLWIKHKSLEFQLDGGINTWNCPYLNTDRDDDKDISGVGVGVFWWQSVAGGITIDVMAGDVGVCMWKVRTVASLQSIVMHCDMWHCFMTLHCDELQQAAASERWLFTLSACSGW